MSLVLPSYTLKIGPMVTSTAIQPKTFESYKRRKTRVEVAYLNKKIPKSLGLGSWNATRVFGDLLLWTDLEHAKQYGLNCLPFNITKTISSFEMNATKGQINVFYHPYSEFNMKELLEQYEDSPDKSLSEVIKLLKDIDGLGPELGTLFHGIPKYQTRESWMDLVRRAEEPFEPRIKFDDGNAPCTMMVVWQVVQYGGTWDLIARSVSVSTKMINEAGYTLDDVSSNFQAEGLPTFFGCGGGEDPRLNLSRFLNKMLLFLKSKGNIGDEQREMQLTTKSGYQKIFNSALRWKILSVNDDVFFVSHKQFVNTPKMLGNKVTKPAILSTMKPRIIPDPIIFDYLIEERKRDQLETIHSTSADQTETRSI